MLSYDIKYTSNGSIKKFQLNFYWLQQNMYKTKNHNNNINNQNYSNQTTKK